MAGSRAVGACEPGQIRKEAALSESAHAPRISLAGAEDRRARPRTCFDGGCTVHLIARPEAERLLGTAGQDAPRSYLRTIRIFLRLTPEAFPAGSVALMVIR